MYYLATDTVAYWIVNSKELKNLKYDGAFAIAQSEDKESLRELKELLVNRPSLQILNDEY